MLDRGKCPFKHGKNKDAALSTEEHTTIINYAEAIKKEAHAVTMSEVISNGWVDKWKGAVKPAWQQKRIFQWCKRDRLTAGACTKKQRIVSSVNAVVWQQIQFFE